MACIIHHRRSLPVLDNRRLMYKIAPAPPQFGQLDGKGPVAQVVSESREPQLAFGPSNPNSPHLPRTAVHDAHYEGPQ